MNNNNELIPALAGMVSKTEIANRASSMAQDIIAQGKSLDVYCEIQAAIELLEKLKAELKPTATEMVDELCGGSSSADYRGVKVQIKSSPARYDFKGIKCYEAAKARVKSLETMLKNATPDTPYIDPNTAERIDGVTPTYGEDTIVVILPK